MELKINQFKKLSNLTVSLPAIVEGANGVGKTSIIEAFSFVLTGKDLNGNVFDKKIYLNEEATEQAVASVELKSKSGDVISRTCTPVFVRKKGEEVAVLKTAISTSLKINGTPCNNAEFSNFLEKNDEELLLGYSVQFFKNLDNQKQRKLLMDIAEAKGISKDTYFLGLEDKKQVKYAISELKKEEISLKAQIELLNNQILETKIAEEKNVSEKIKETQTKIENLQNSKNNAEIPKHVVQHNFDVNAKIQEVQNEIFKPTCNFREIANLDDTTNLKTEIRNLESSKIELKDNLSLLQDLRSYQKDLENFKMNPEISRLEKILENYAYYEKQEKCLKCPICVIENCSEKETELLSESDLEYRIEELRNEDNFKYMRILNNIENLENSLKKLEAFNDDAFLKNQQIEGKVQNLISEIRKINEKNEALKIQNSENAIYNIKIEQKIAEEKKLFETQKSEKIQELKKQLKSFEFDFSEIDSKILEEKNKLVNLQNIFEEYKKTIHNLEYTKNLLKETEIKKQENAKNLALKEQVLQKINNAEYLYVTDCEKTLNSINQNLKFKMFAKNISNDDYSEVCEIYHNLENLNLLNHSRELIARYDLCDFFQNYFELDMPILIDNASEITTELSNFDNRKKATLLVANYESLKITPTAL